MLERLEFENARAAEQRSHNFERRVFGGRANQGDSAVLDGGQDGVLLGLVETMYLVYEERCADAPIAAVGIGGGDDLAQFSNAAGDG